ncbi:LysR substrate-binding domain-containing protein [Massilia sp. YIM B02769]|jgi:DNA-binding transcriptional LysR family regulator|uniref:LysR substrate-binding domain-containing protein n=1 Tax=unclassified Massilia TaxID=2609279 RepID=UPI0025B68459|nr:MULTISPECIES: LysR substrate-binding domain-containing protein [unclassified Massilia]MDN4060309.1 LysR substrate-binding domain-containing protein [Massilia sp. YIM B02769]
MRDSSSTRFIRFHLKTRHMVLLVELGRHASILHAAEAAGLTQPGASKLIGELEHALGVPLFERLPRGVVPTWYGQVLIRRAGAALAEMDAAHQEIMQGQAGFGGRVAIGSVRAPAASLLPQAVKLLKERNPRVQVAVSSDTSQAMIEGLRAGELDIVIGRILDPAAAAELDFEPLADEPHSLIVRAGHPWLNRADLGFDELSRAPWILPAPGRLRDQLMALFIARGLPQPDDVVETISLPLITRLLADSERVVALPPELVQSALDAGTLAALPLDVDLRAGVYGIVTRKRHHLAPSAEAMLAALREAAGLTPPVHT